MTTFTFRTETIEDDNRAGMLLTSLNINFEYAMICDSDMPTYKMGKFTFSVNHSLDKLRDIIMSKIENEDELYYDLHRCYQTLSIGQHPIKLFQR